MSGQQQKNRPEQEAFPGESRSDAPKTTGKGTETLVAKHKSEGLAGTERPMEEVCELENCKQATPSVLQRLESWLRRRFRSVVWKQWKSGRTRFRELHKRGVGKHLAAQTAGSPQGPWRIANSPALSIALSNAYFAELRLLPLIVRS